MNGVNPEMLEPNVDRLEEFETLLVNLVSGVIECFEVRFWLVRPDADVNELVCYHPEMQPDVAYQQKYQELDPLHSSRFENTDINIVCTNTVMSEATWKSMSFYTEFMAPRRYEYNTDVFLRRNSKIIAVIALLRDSSMSPFSKQELVLLTSLRPLLEFSLNSIYPPEWSQIGDNIRTKYGLTDREMDVAEIVMAGVNTKVMARELGLSIATIKTHLQHIFEKTGVHTTKELIAILFRAMAP